MIRAEASTNFGHNTDNAPLSEAIVAIGILSSAVLLLPESAAGEQYHFVGKEFALVTTACAALAVSLTKRRLAVPKTEVGLICAVVLLSMCAAASNPGYTSIRAISYTLALAAAHLAVRGVPADRRSGLIPTAVSVSLLVLALSALLEAFGVLSISSTGRAPGGLVTNRNYLAEASVIGLPSIIWMTTAGPQYRRVGASIALSLSTIVIVISQCRTAWLGGIVALLTLCTAYILCPGSRNRPLRRSAVMISVVILASVFAAGTIELLFDLQAPESLTSSLMRVFDLRHGSGRGRVADLVIALRMVRDQPALGIGPGGWEYSYALYASPGSNLFLEDVAAGKLPSGEWVGWLAERGILSLLTLAILGLYFAILCVRNLSVDFKSGSALATLAATAIIGSGDISLSHPTIGFMAVAGVAAFLPTNPKRETKLSATSARVTLVFVLLNIPGWGYVTIPDIIAYQLLGRNTDPTAVDHLAQLFPHNYSLHVIAAERWQRNGRCDLAGWHAIRAKRLVPASKTPLLIVARCNAPSIKWQ